MANEDLQRECGAYGLPSSDKHFYNIQTLFNYIKSLQEEKDLSAGLNAGVNAYAKGKKPKYANFDPS